MTTDADKLRCAERELRLRLHNYPRWVAKYRMTEQEARHEIACMSAIVEDYRKLVKPALFDGV